MKRTLFIIVFLGVFGWIIYDFAVDKGTGGQSDEGTIIRAEPQQSGDAVEVDETDVVGLEVGNIAPDFELTTFAGDTARLSDHLGERVMLNFWATWCPPCRAEMPDMQKFHEDEDIVILAVNLTQTKSEKDNIAGFIDEFGLTFPVLLDETLAVATEYKIQPIPTTYMIDSNGRIQDKSFGPMTYDIMVEKFERMQ